MAHKKFRGGKRAGGGDAGPGEEEERRLREQTPMQSRADDAADVEGKDIVQLGSEASFPASDPPSWMGAARPGGRMPRHEEGAGDGGAEHGARPPGASE